MTAPADQLVQRLPMLPSELGDVGPGRGTNGPVSAAQVAARSSSAAADYAAYLAIPADLAIDETRSSATFGASP